MQQGSEQLSKILEKVDLRYSESLWRVLQEFIACNSQGASGKTATVLVGGQILQDVGLVAEVVHWRR